MATACRALLDSELSDSDLRGEIFNLIPREELSQALKNIDALVRPPDDVYFSELNNRLPFHSEIPADLA